MKFTVHQRLKQSVCINAYGATGIMQFNCPLHCPALRAKSAFLQSAWHTIECKSGMLIRKSMCKPAALRYKECNKSVTEQERSLLQLPPNVAHLCRFSNSHTIMLLVTPCSGLKLQYCRNHSSSSSSSSSGSGNGGMGLTEQASQ
jgi:hypothetical protein